MKFEIPVWPGFFYEYWEDIIAFFRFLDNGSDFF